MRVSKTNFSEFYSEALASETDTSPVFGLSGNDAKDTHSNVEPNFFVYTDGVVILFVSILDHFNYFLLEKLLN